MASVISALTSGGGGISMTGDASGILNLNSNGTTVVAVTSTGAAVTGTLAATGAITGSSTVAGSTGILYPLTSGTAVATTSGTSIDFTSIPSWVKRITVMLSGVSLSSTSNIQFQIGNGGVAKTSGYLGAYVTNTSAPAVNTLTISSGFVFSNTGASALHNGIVLISLLDSATNTWCASGFDGESSGSRFTSVSGSVVLSGTLNMVRITSTGADTFDAGSVNILYE